MNASNDAISTKLWIDQSEVRQLVAAVTKAPVKVVHLAPNIDRDTHMVFQTGGDADTLGLVLHSEGITDTTFATLDIASTQLAMSKTVLAAGVAFDPTAAKTFTRMGEQLTDGIQAWAARMTQDVIVLRGQPKEGTPRQLFDTAYNGAEEVVYNPGWANGTGYLDKCPGDLKPGKVVRFTDSHNRRAVGINLTGFPIVVFERYSPTTEGERSDVLVANGGREPQDEDTDEFGTMIPGSGSVASNTGCLYQLVQAIHFQEGHKA